MPGPTLTLAFILATLSGAVFHLLVGGDARRLALFLLAGWLGFSIGHLAGVAFNISLFAIGTLRVLPAFLGAFVALIIALVFTIRRPANRLSR